MAARQTVRLELDYEAADLLRACVRRHGKRKRRDGEFAHRTNQPAYAQHHLAIADRCAALEALIVKAIGGAS